MGGAEHATKFGVTLPLPDIGGDPATVRIFAHGAEAAAYDSSRRPDHVWGINVASPPAGRGRNLYRDPFSLFGLLETSAHLGALERNHHWRIASRSLQAHL